MITGNSIPISSSVRSIYARVELYDGSTLLNTFHHDDFLKSIKVDRLGNTDRFFGFGICQKVNVHVIDVNREITVTAGNRLEVVMGTDESSLYTFPVFYVSEVHRDEKTNELSITAYDCIYEASKHTISEIVLPETFTLEGYVAACAAIIDIPYKLEVSDDAFLASYTASTVNLEGTETLREILNDIAEATQTIYYISKDWELVFKRLDKEGLEALTIDKSQYFSLESKTNRRLTGVAHTTELGDNYIAQLEITGTTQYVRNNPFWELINDVESRVNKALDYVGGLTINQFNCEWRGNYLLEIGDRIGLVTKDDEKVYSYVLCDTVEYKGYLRQNTYWSYSNSDAESMENPTAGVNMSDVLKKTYAKVDKVNKQIDLVVGETSGFSDRLAAVEMTTDSVTTTVSRVEKSTNNQLAEMNDDITELARQVEMAVTPEDVSIMISKEVTRGTQSVTTTTGFVFDEEGLTISKSDSEMETLITEDGMTVSRSGSAVLIANNEGVRAKNLHATTYLIVGDNSRFEDYGGGRTGCFWIGG